MSRQASRRSRLIIGLTLALLPGIAGAQTPDESTPAGESVCDPLIGSTPALYGLCIAYCEAQDLDAVDLSAPDVWKSAPNRAILDNYRSRMEPGDPDMPCLRPEPACPCWTEGELANAYPTTLASFQCATDDGTITNVSYGTILNSPADSSFEQRCQPYAYGPPIAWAAEFADDDIRSCFLQDPAHSISTFFLITPSEYEICKTSLENRVAALGEECVFLATNLYGLGETCDFHD